MAPLQQSDQTVHDPASTPARAHPVARALALGPVLYANAAHTERDRRVALETLEGLRRAGLLRLTTPRTRGGFEATVRTQIEVGLALGRACPSTARVAGIHNGVRPMTLMLSAAAQDEFYDPGPDVLVCSVAGVNGTADRGDGGVRITGTWTAASGCEDAHWALLAIPLPDTAGGPPSTATVLVPLEDLQVKDTWHVAGMRGTGGQSLGADTVLVPDHRVVSAAVAPSGGAAVFPTASKIGSSLNLLAPVVGAALGALDTVRRTLGSGRGITVSVYRETTASPSAQLRLGEADRLVDRAVRLVGSVTDAADAALTGDPLTLRERSALRMDMVAAVESARTAVSRLLDLSGTAAFSESNPVQRFSREMETGSRHVQFKPFLAARTTGGWSSASSPRSPSCCEAPARPA
ncbi:acyl-CoA dehydrogenase family protein [Streptomyces griseoloalbus]|uniref:Acyl-CoA dehydrogenase family protein n=1 Tax=Streptomyces griseoloalbus TaxID=67303 RepID=A0ABV3E5Q5_9ACTN